MPGTKKTWLPLLAGVAFGALVTVAATQYRISVMTKEVARMEEEVDKSKREQLRLRRKYQEGVRTVEHYRLDADEVHKLRSQVTELRRALASTAKLIAASTNAVAQVIAPGSRAVNRAPITGLPVKFDSIDHMSAVVADIRAKAFAGQLSPQEQEWLGKIEPELERLEETPAEFAQLQASLIAKTAGISDPARITEIRQVLQRTYDTALVTGLDMPSRPEDDQQWKQDRRQLDRRGTAALLNLLNDEEREAFDQAFTGVMGIDLGLEANKLAASRQSDGGIAED